MATLQADFIGATAMLVDDVSHAASILKRGEVLAYPTEAVWGLGCDPFQADAFAKILHLKNRPIDKGVILLADHTDRVSALLDLLPLETKQRVVDSWLNTDPHARAHTWLLPHAGHIPAWICGQHDLVAVRVTRHPLCRALCHAFGGLIVSTSANPNGLEPARSLAQAQLYFAEHVRYLRGDVGQSSEPSRIINAISGEIIRN